MNGLSSVLAADLTAGDDRLIGEGPLALTSVVVCERTGIDAAAVLLTGAGGEGPYYALRLDPGAVLAFSDPVALPWGLLITCQTGELSISVGYR